MVCHPAIFLLAFMWTSRYVLRFIEIEAEEGSPQPSEVVTESKWTQMDCTMFVVDERRSFLERRHKLHSITEREGINQNSSKTHNFRVKTHSNDSEIMVCSPGPLEVFWDKL